MKSIVKLALLEWREGGKERQHEEQAFRVQVKGLLGLNLYQKLQVTNDSRIHLIDDQD